MTLGYLQNNKFEIIQTNLSNMDNVPGLLIKTGVLQLSDKQISLFKKTYRIAAQTYYQNQTNNNAQVVITLNHLLQQTITTQRDAERLAILSMLEILKVKSRSNQQLSDSVIKTIEHMKKPSEKPMQFQTIYKCFKNPDLFSVGCTFAFLFYSNLLRAQNVDWKLLISQIGKNPAVNTEMSLQLLNLVCKDNEGHARHVVKSGFVKYIFSFYLGQKIQDKYLLYKALKFLKFIANADRSVVRDRQKALAQVIYQYDQYIPVVEDLCNKCYEEQYCGKIYQKNHYDGDQLDLSYVWSYNSIFALNFPEQNFKLLILLVEGKLTKLLPQLQTKAYAILNNTVKYGKNNVEKIFKNPPTHQQALLNYLKLIASAIENDSGVYKKVDFQTLKKLVEDSTNPKSQKMFKYIESFNQNQKANRTSQINPKLLEMFSIQKNADMLMEGANKVPKDNSQLKVIKDILGHQRGANEFQNDILNSAKQKALNSLSTAIIQKRHLDLNSVLTQVPLDNVQALAKLLKVLEIALMMGHYQVDEFDQKKVFQIIQWMENHYQGQLIDWGAIGQLIMIFAGEEEWTNHLGELPDKCFWLLGCVDISEKQYEKVLQTLEKMFPTANKQLPTKIPLAIGFLGKSLNLQQKAKIIEKFSNSYLKFMQNSIKNQQNWKSNLYMQSIFMNKWHSENTSINKTFEKMIQPVHRHILDHFKNSQHQYRYLQACLPYKIAIEKLSDNIDFILSQYGQLASYIFKNAQPKVNINYDKIANLSNLPHSESENILETLKFLKENHEVMQNDEVYKLLKKILATHEKYWQLYPNFVGIVNAILEISAKSDNPTIVKNLTEILNELLNHLLENQEITPEETDQILEQLLSTLKELAARGVNIDIERLKRIVNKLQNQKLGDQLLKVLDNYKISQRPKEKQVRSAQILNINQGNSTKSSETIAVQPNTINPAKINNFPTHNKPSQQKYEENSPQRNYMTKLQATKENNKNQDVQATKEHLWVDKKDNQNVFENIQQLNEENEEVTGEGMTVVQALKKLKMIIEKKVSTNEFDSCLEVFRRKEIKSNQKDILGHLLVRFYLIEQRREVFELLLSKAKTNLSKQSCYQIICKHVEAFVLSQRWKLVGRDWMDIAMQRLTQGFFGDACQVVEYNLINNNDLVYFSTKKYHQTVVKNIYTVNTDNDAVFYLLLIGTSARLADIKKFYVQEKIHLSILSYVDKYPKNYKVIANTFYALSSLVYVQSQICLEIVKKQKQMVKLLDGMRDNYDSKAVIESGGCFLANMAYSNDEVKEVLRSYKVVEKLIYIFQQNLKLSPQIATFKQLLRAFGNLSLAEKCAKEIMDMGFCRLEVQMIEMFNMFVNLDQNKLRLLKIAIDVFANLCSHKYNLQVMHQQGVTSTIIMLLQTTEINPPIIMGCIDTVDGLCQNQDIQFFAVSEKKLPYILIDILKIQQDEKIIVKATRLLTNLTINHKNIAYILEANLLSVLANIVMPSFFMKYNAKTQLNYLSNNPTASTPPNQKMELYINKILIRIFNSKQNIDLILKSGYLDCLVRTIQTADNVEDVYIDILSFFAKDLPNFLNKRVFMCLIRVLTRKIKNNEIIEKCLKIFKTLLLHSHDRDQEDVVIEGTPKMYEKMLQAYKMDTLYLLSLHCTISKKLRKLLISTEKQYKVIQMIYEATQHEQSQQLANSVLFTLFNKEQAKSKKEIQSQVLAEEKAFCILTQGLVCQLFRIDGSSKRAVIKMTDDYSIVAFKYPDGEVKRKYHIDLKKLRDWQFGYEKGSRQWKLSVFNKNRGMFSSEVPPQCCGTLVGGLKWGEIAYINVSFNSKEEKEQFKKALETIMAALL